MAEPHNQRRDPRRPVLLAARCRTMGGMRDDGFLADISTQGCCVTARSLFFHVGMRIIIKPEGIEGIPGVVRWIEGNRAGVQFDTPIYPPVVEHLIQRFPAERAVGVTGAGPT